MPPLRLLAVLAHPDDESLGIGGTLAKAAQEGIETFLVVATRGERGRLGSERPGGAVLGPIRERELREAASVLGVREVTFLDYLDAEVDQVEPRLAIERIAREIRRIRPQVVITFAHDGNYGHPDHVAVSQLTGAAIVEARAGSDDGAPHRVDKLYWFVSGSEQGAAYRKAFGELSSQVDGVRRVVGDWPDWSISATIDARAHWRQVWKAVQCHASQLPGYRDLPAADERLHEAIWGRQEFYRVWSFVNGGRRKESDLFEGLR